MVIIRLMGGLGNQMFQYALARKLIHIGKQVKLDLSYYDSIPNKDTFRKFELDRFNCCIEKASGKEIKRYNNILRKGIDMLGRFTKWLEPRCIIETEYYFKPEILEVDNKCLVGYWQSENYFKDIREVLLNEFQFNTDNIGKKNIALENKIKNSNNTVSIHVRAGDYLNQYNASNLGNICTDEYYNKACQYCVNQLGEVQFVLFTNDAEWVRKNIKLDRYNVTIVDWNTEDTGWIDMYLMSLCKHNIIANSSFSWWAAWLNQNENKMVIGPSYWTQGRESDDIVPKEWIRL